MDITVGVINWRRPENVVKIVAALQAQDAPCRPLVVTNPSSYPLPPVDCPTVSVADLGPYSRYLPEYAAITCFSSTTISCRPRTWFVALWQRPKNIPTTS